MWRGTALAAGTIAAAATMGSVKAPLDVGPYADLSLVNEAALRLGRNRSALLPAQRWGALLISCASCRTEMC